MAIESKTQAHEIPTSLPIVIVLCLLALTVFVYQPVLGSFFDAQEFESFLLPLQLDRSISDYLLTSWAWKVNEQRRGFFRPLLSVVFMIEYHIFGLSPTPYRLVSLFFHIQIALLLYLIVMRVSGHPAPAVAASLLFLVHPANYFAVSWISARGDIMAAMFLLVAMQVTICILSKPIAALWATVPGILLLAAIMSKELGIAGFVLLPLIYVLWPKSVPMKGRTFIFFSTIGAVFLIFFASRWFLFDDFGGYQRSSDLTYFLPQMVLVVKAVTGTAFINRSWSAVMTTGMIVVLIMFFLSRGWESCRISVLFIVSFMAASFQSLVAVHCPHYLYFPCAIFCCFIMIVLNCASQAIPRHAGKLMWLVCLCLIPVAWWGHHENRDYYARTLAERERLAVAIDRHITSFQNGATYQMRNPPNTTGLDRDSRYWMKLLPYYVNYLKGADSIVFVLNGKGKRRDEVSGCVVWDGESLRITKDAKGLLRNTLNFQ